MKRHSRRSSDKQKIRRITLLVVTVLLLGFLAPRLLSWVAMVALYPVHATQTWFAQTSLTIPALWRDKLALQQQVLELEADMQQQAEPSVSERRLREENNRLRTLLRATTSDRIAAAVIARPGQLPYDILQIDQGSTVGVTVGAPVYVNDEEVLGLVSQVYPRSALVTLFSSPGFTTTAYVGQSDVLASLEGFGGGVARVALPQGVPLLVDSLVYVPSIQPGVFGRIVAVENEPTQPQQFGYIVHSIPLQQIRFVSVGAVTDMQTDAVDISQYIEQITQTLALPDIIISTSSATSTASTTATSSLDQPTQS